MQFAKNCIHALSNLKPDTNNNNNETTKEDFVDGVIDDYSILTIQIHCFSG